MPSRRTVVSLLAAGLAGCTALRADPDPEPPGSTSYAWPSINATPANARAVPDGTIRNPEPDSPAEYGVDAIDVDGSYARAPVVVDGKTVLVAPAPAEEDDGCVVTCLDTGERQGWPEVRWQRRLEREFPDGAATIADDRVVLTVSDETGVYADGDGLLAALSTADGKLEWSRPLDRGRDLRRRSPTERCISVPTASCTPSRRPTAVSDGPRRTWFRSHPRSAWTRSWS